LLREASACSWLWSSYRRCSRCLGVVTIIRARFLISTYLLPSFVGRGADQYRGRDEDWPPLLRLLFYQCSYTHFGHCCRRLSLVGCSPKNRATMAPYTSDPGSFPEPIDLTHHLSRSTRARQASSVKQFYKYFSIPGIAQLAGGMRSRTYVVPYVC
jgi:hypothetical protein